MMKGWGSLTVPQINRLYEATDTGDARFQHYNLFLQDTGWPDNDETWVLWSQMACVAIATSQGRA